MLGIASPSDETEQERVKVFLSSYAIFFLDKDILETLLAN